MNQQTVLLASWAAAAVAGLAAIAAVASNQAATAPAASLPVTDDLERGIASLGDGLTASRRALADLAARVDALEQQPRQAVAAAAAPPPAAASSPPPPAAMPAPEAAPSLPSPERLRALRANLPRMFRNGLRDGSLSEQEQQDFWSLARAPGVIDQLLREQEEQVNKAPSDIAARLELADLYTTKLLTIPGGPEQGVWGSKAERQWQAVIEQDANHWEARFLLGFNYSMYPAFVDRSKEAIEHLEAARALQGPLPAEPRQVEVFTALARMYTRQRQHERARAALAEGLARFPEDDRLLRAQRQLRDK